MSSKSINADASILEKFKQNMGDNKNIFKSIYNDYLDD
jgi:hypothetical protein